jgi:hypothetical protein
MEKILENLWVLFMGIMSWILTRVFSKIDDLEKEKSDGKTTREEILANSNRTHEVDRRVDEIQHTTIPRQEHKTDVASLVEKIAVCHERINDLERRKADKIKNIRTHASKEKNSES